MVVLCDEVMNMVHSSTLASKKRSPLVQTWLEMMVQLRTFQFNLLSGIQDTLQQENKYKTLVRPVFSGVQVDDQGMHSILGHLAV